MRDEFRLAIRGEPTYHKGEPVPLTFEIENVSDTDYRLLVWNTPLEGEVFNFLEVRRGDHVVPYDGRLVKRGDPAPDSYRRIAAGETIVEELDISESYAMDEPGYYDVTLRVQFFDAIPDVGVSLAARTRQEQRGFALDPVTAGFELLPDGNSRPTAGERARREEPRDGPRRLTVDPGAVQQDTELRDLPLPPGFPEVFAADANARAWLDSANAELASWSGRADNTLYTEWFGADSASRYQTLRDHFSAIRAYMNRPHTYDLSPPHCPADAFAYTHYGSDTVYICSLFFSAPTTGIESQFGTLVHEWSHAAVNTEDIVYGQTKARELADTRPDAALNNADNHAYFVETLCRRVVTAPLFWPNGKVYLFTGGEYYRYDPATQRVDAGYPKPIAGNWPGLWGDRIDAAVLWNNGKAYFFRDDQYMRYDIAADKVDAGYPLTTSPSWPGLWGDRIDAAVLWNNGKAYFFRDDQYMRYDIAADKVDAGYPKPILGNWPGLWGDGIQGSVMWNNGKAYFLRGWQYMGYDVAADRTDPAFPRAIAENWPGLWGDGHIDAAIMYNNGNAYVFRGTAYRAYDVAQDRVIYPDYPLPIAGNWPGLWDRVDSGIPWPNGKVYFFRGSEYMSWDIAANRVDPGYPKPIAGNWPGLWGDRIDAAVLWNNGKAYFFRDSQYMRYDIAADKVDAGYPLPISPYWPGLWGDRIDAAVLWNNGKAYFFRDSQYMRYDIAADKVDAGYPLPIGSNWPGLPGRVR